MTPKNVRNVCMNLIRIPRMMKEKGDVSFRTLVEESGYFEMHDHITIEGIREVLFEHPNRVNDWIQFSEDQRCSPAWFIRKDGTDYEVGFFSSEADDNRSTKYSDPLEACATFIKHEVEQVRLLP